MSLARWDPFGELRSIEDQMSRLFRRPPAWRGPPDEALTTTEFAPPADVYEDENKIAFKMEVPGIDPKDLDVRVDGNTLTVSGERKFKTDEKKENFHRIETSYGCFCRSFALPGSADTDNVNANFNMAFWRLRCPSAPRPEASRSKSRTAPARRNRNRKQRDQFGLAGRRPVQRASPS